MFVYNPDVEYKVIAVKDNEEKALLTTKSAGRQPITQAIKSSSKLILDGWVVSIFGNNELIFRIVPFSWC